MLKVNNLTIDTQNMLRDMQQMADMARGLHLKDTSSDTPSFENVLSQAVSQVKELSTQALAADVTTLQAVSQVNDLNGQTHSLPSAASAQASLQAVMLASERAEFALQNLVQISDKAIKAYQDIAQMQV